MGSKTVTGSQSAKRAHKCTICGKTFSTEPALASHSRRIHFTMLKNKPSMDDKRVGILRKGLNVAVIERPKAEILPKKRVIRTEWDYTKDIHFACPKCERLFKSYFSSRQHIVRYHCVNDKDEPVAEDSPDIIKPIQRERCLKCQVNVNSNEFHICSLNPDDLDSELYVCLGCKQHFASIKLFDVHIPGLHSDGVQSMFFQNLNDIIDWIVEIENSTDTNYKLMSYNTSRQIYRCTYLPNDINSNNIQLCPSSLHILEFPKGFQVNFYTCHHGHECKVYEITEKDKKNLITSLLQRADSYKNIADSLSDPNDQYVQFKNVMEKVILEAAKLDAKSLRQLMGKALEMSEVLNNYENNDDDTDNEKPNLAVLNLNDSQITDALQDTGKSRRNKRKSSLSPIPHEVVEIKVEKQSSSNRKKPMGRRKGLPLIVSSYSIKSEDGSEKADAKTDDNITYTSPKTRFLDSLSESPSFNDTYKNFIGKTLVDTPVPINRRLSKKNIVKTKIGQFKPNSPKKSTVSATKLDSLPSPSPIHIEALPKDISYEIKEQEDDCNILILKF